MNVAKSPANKQLLGDFRIYPYNKANPIRDLKE
jgi:hypothetical protein